MDVSVNIFGDKEFIKLLNQLGGIMSDLRPVFFSLKDDWYKNNKALFTLKGPGKYRPYTGKRDASGNTAYMRWKSKHSIQKKPYPMLKAKNGRIESGTTDENSEYTYKQIEKQMMALGVKGIIYAGVQQKTRPFIFNKKSGGEFYQVQIKRFKSLLETVIQRRLAVLKAKGKIQ